MVVGDLEKGVVVAERCGRTHARTHQRCDLCFGVYCSGLWGCVLQRVVFRFMGLELRGLGADN